MKPPDPCHVEPIVKSVDDKLLDTAQSAYLAVTGMGCKRCAIRVRNSLLQLGGVLIADVFLEDGLAAVAFNPAQTFPQKLLTAVESAGIGTHHHYLAELLTTRPLDETLTIMNGRRN